MFDISTKNMFIFCRLDTFLTPSASFDKYLDLEHVLFYRAELGVIMRKNNHTYDLLKSINTFAEK